MPVPRELNEALVSRFLVVDMMPLDGQTLTFLLRKYFPDMKETALEQFAGLFLDLQRKAGNPGRFPRNPWIFAA